MGLLEIDILTIARPSFGNLRRSPIKVQWGMRRLTTAEIKAGILLLVLCGGFICVFLGLYFEELTD